MTTDGLLSGLSQSNRPVIVNVWAPWCIPCRRMEPLIAGLAETYADQVDVWHISADEQPDLVKELGVYGIPTLVVFQGTREVARRTGSQTEADLVDLFEAARLGRGPSRQGVRRVDRLLRGGAGLALLALGWLSEPSWLFFLIGGGVLFSAVYDRCPLWQMVSARLKTVFGRGEV